MPQDPAGYVSSRHGPAGAGQFYVAPRNGLEAELASIWEEVLDVSRIGVYDNFFDRGGHSLMAVRLIARMETAFGKRVDLLSLFLGPTVAETVAVLSQDSAEPAGSSSRYSARKRTRQSRRVLWDRFKFLPKAD